MPLWRLQDNRPDQLQVKGAYAFWANLATMKNYDLLFDACEAQLPSRDTVGPAYTNMKSYLEAGGRLIGEHYQYNWFATSTQCGGDVSCKGPADFNGVATWGATNQTNPPETVDVSHPRGQVFSDWLVAVGASSTRRSPPERAQRP